MVDAVRHYPSAFDFEAVSEDGNPYGRAELRVVGVGYGVDERFSNCLERNSGCSVRVSPSIVMALRVRRRMKRMTAARSTSVADM